MAKNVVNEKGFKIIALKPDECKQIGFGFQDETDFELICDNCNTLINDELYVFYVCVLNRVFCNECFQEWYEDAVYYPEDARYENNKYENVKSLIGNSFKNIDYYKLWTILKKFTMNLLKNNILKNVLNLILAISFILNIL